ncbi:MAG TPA: DinB family protein [Pyrinomonadaceae bacterium]|nr:DinB family protein [Pyrinomonadaceae bacterium]
MCPPNLLDDDNEGGHAGPPLPIQMPERIIRPINGFSRDIGYYLAGMEEVRAQLREAVLEISSEDIGRLAIPDAHSIGGLVLHIGEAEWWWMNCVISGREVTQEIATASFWDVLEEPERVSQRGYSAQFCLDEIEKIRDQTRALLATFDDNRMDEVFAFERKGKTNELSLRWILHHLIDHEAQHKGQILMLKRLLGLQNEQLLG